MKNLQSLRAQVALQEERALQLSLTAYARLEAEELVEAWAAAKGLARTVSEDTSSEGLQLTQRLGAVMAELQGLQVQRFRGTGLSLSVPPQAA